MKTNDIGPLFFAPAKFQTNLDRLPLFGTLPSQESEPPYRRATTLFARIPYTDKGIIVGWWRRSKTDPDSALMNAIAGAGFDLDDQIDEEDKRTVREIVAEHSNGDLDDEWQIINMLGLESH